LAVEVDVRKADLRMKSRLSVALLTALAAMWIAAAVPSDAGSCRRHGARGCPKQPATLDFSSDPDVFNDIVGNQPHSRPPTHRAPIDPQPTASPYTGPMIGRSHVGVPTVGYYWSIN
jgi:hypothetical protein